MTTVSAVLAVDISAAVDDLDLLLMHEAARLLPTIPVGVPVRLEIGSASALVGGLGHVGQSLRNARSVEVAGSNAAGVAEMRRLLARAFLVAS